MALDLTKQLEAVEKALFQGALSVQYEDKRITYRSVAELERVRDRLRVEIHGPRKTLIYPTHDRGLDR